MEVKRIAWECIIENMNKSIKLNLTLAKNHDLEDRFLTRMEELITKLKRRNQGNKSRR